MSDENQNEQTDLELTIKEAETYLSQGLYSESLEIFELLISEPAQLDPDQLTRITEKIDLIKKEIENLESEETEITAEDLTFLKETWAPEETVHEIISSASALKELGLFKEALEEYKKLFDQDYPTAKIVLELTDCLFETHSPSRVIDQVEKIISEKKIDDTDKADIHFSLGMEMEKEAINKPPRNSIIEEKTILI